MKKQLMEAKNQKKLDIKDVDTIGFIAKRS